MNFRTQVTLYLILMLLTFPAETLYFSVNVMNPSHFTLMSDQYRIFPYKINTIASRQVTVIIIIIIIIIITIIIIIIIIIIIKQLGDN